MTVSYAPPQHCTSCETGWLGEDGTLCWQCGMPGTPGRVRVWDCTRSGSTATYNAATAEDSEP